MGPLMKAARGSLGLINQGKERNSSQGVGLSHAKALGQECVRIINIKKTLLP